MALPTQPTAVEPSSLPIQKQIMLWLSGGFNYEQGGAKAVFIKQLQDQEAFLDLLKQSKDTLTKQQTEEGAQEQTEVQSRLAALVAAQQLQKLNAIINTIETNKAHSSTISQSPETLADQLVLQISLPRTKEDNTLNPPDQTQQPPTRQPPQVRNSVRLLGTPLLPDNNLAALTSASQSLRKAKGTQVTPNNPAINSSVQTTTAQESTTTINPTASTIETVMPKAPKAQTMHQETTPSQQSSAVKKDDAAGSGCCYCCCCGSFWSSKPSSEDTKPLIPR